MAEHNDFGKLGEDVAAKHLLEKGYKILDRNWIYQKKELDIVALKDDVLVVVEVKSRSTEYFEHPSDTITPSKIKFLVHATQGYVDSKEIEQEVRFDVISVIKQDSKFVIEHIEDAFSAPVD
jgi:putative endonuclease